jgi:GT2 family glycosyltransferase
MLAPFKKDPDIMIVAPLLKTYTDDSVEDFFIKYYISQAPAFLTDLLRGETADHYPLERISGACFAFGLRQERYPYAYFFDPLFFMYYEDEELCQRIRAAGGKIVLTHGGAVFYHRHSNTDPEEDRDAILRSQLLSRNILRLKEPFGRMSRAYYSIWAATVSRMLDHLLRGQLKAFFLYGRSLFAVTFMLPRIARTRREDRRAAGLKPS